MTDAPHYRTDLAWIHHAGFSEFALLASRGVLALLTKLGIRDGLIVDVGCGSGVLARALTDAGFDVLGIDASPSMIELAHTTAPAARFEIGSFDEAALPRCAAITAMGEVLNYGTLDRVRTFAHHAASALPPRGLLLFDVAERESYPPHDERRVGGDKWSVIAIKDSDGKRLTRRVLTFRQINGVTRRDEEVHVLELYEREELLAILRQAGFRVRVRRSYGTYRLPKGHAVYVAERRRPRRRSTSLQGLELALPQHVNLQATLIDIDGTLVDSNDKHTDCWVEAFAHFGKRMDRKVVREQIGKGGDLLVPDTLDAREMRTFGEALQKFRGQLWKEKYMRTVQPFPGAVDALRALHARGIKLALASSSNPDEVEYYVDVLGVGDLLEGTTSKEDAEFSKPSPEIFRAALERVKSDPARTLAVGDTPYDILAAHRTPVPIAAVLCGGFPRQSLAKAEFLFDDVPAMLKELNRIDEYFRE